jgi:hypothetical protein
VSKVMLAVAWPSCFCTALTLAPWRIISEAAVCRRSYSRSSSGSGSGRLSGSSPAMAWFAASMAGLKRTGTNFEERTGPTSRRGEHQIPRTRTTRSQDRQVDQRCDGAGIIRTRQRLGAASPKPASGGYIDW